MSWLPSSTLVIAALALGTACGTAETQASSTPAASSDAHAAAPVAAAPEHAAAADSNTTAAAAGTLTGTVTETADGGGYTYVLIDTGSEQVWAAGPQTAVSVGTKVRIESTMPMRGFQSGSLGRTFDLIYFTGTIELL